MSEKIKSNKIEIDFMKDYESNTVTIFEARNLLTREQMIRKYNGAVCYKYLKKDQRVRLVINIFNQSVIIFSGKENKNFLLPHSMSFLEFDDFLSLLKVCSKNLSDSVDNAKLETITI